VSVADYTDDFEQPQPTSQILPHSKVELDDYGDSGFETAALMAPLNEPQTTEDRNDYTDVGNGLCFTVSAVTPISTVPPRAATRDIDDGDEDAGEGDDFIKEDNGLLPPKESYLPLSCFFPIQSPLTLRRKKSFRTLPPWSARASPALRQHAALHPLPTAGLLLPSTAPYLPRHLLFLCRRSPPTAGHVPLRG